MRPSCQGLSSSVDGGREAKGWAPAEAALLLEEGLGPLQEETVPTPLQRRRCCPRSRPGLALTPPASSPQGRKLLGPLHFGPVLSPPPLPAQLCTLSRPPPGDPACPCHHEPDSALQPEGCPRREEEGAGLRWGRGGPGQFPRGGERRAGAPALGGALGRGARPGAGGGTLARPPCGAAIEARPSGHHRPSVPTSCQIHVLPAPSHPNTSRGLELGGPRWGLAVTLP